MAFTFILAAWYRELIWCFRLLSLLGSTLSASARSFCSTGSAPRSAHCSFARY